MAGEEDVAIYSGSRGGYDGVDISGGGGGAIKSSTICFSYATRFAKLRQLF